MSEAVRHALLLAHRWAGLCLAGFLVMAGLTGSVLAFGEEIDAALNPALFETGARVLPSTQQMAAAVTAVEAGGAALSVVRLPDAAGEPARFRRAGVEREWFLDPASGRVLGSRAVDGCCLERENLVGFLLRLHESLTLGSVGEWIMGGVGLVWAVDCVNGLLLTLPRRRPMLARWGAAWRVKRGAAGFRLVFDLHRAGGLWCWLALLAMALSGAALALYLEVFSPAVTAVLPTTPIPTAAAPTGAPIGLGEALARAEAAWEGERPRFLWAYRPPGANTVIVASRTDGRGAEWGVGPDQTVIDAGSGAVMARLRSAEGRAGDLVMAVQFPLHSGQIVGLAGKIAVCVSGLLTAGLSVTGVWLWWRKRSARLRRPVGEAARLGAA